MLPDGDFKTGTVDGNPLAGKLPVAHAAWWAQGGAMTGSDVDSVRIADTVTAHGANEAPQTPDSVSLGDTFAVAATGVDSGGSAVTAAALLQQDVYAALVVDDLAEADTIPARGWRHTPDWSQPVVERWQWRTDIQRSKSGRETRRVIWSEPRRRMSHRVVTRDVDEIDRALSGWQTGRWLVPRWPDAAKTTQAVTAGAVKIPANAAGGEWRVGGPAIVLGDVLEAHTIAAVYPDRVEVATGLRNELPAGSVVYPARVMRLPSQVSVGRPTAGLAANEIEWLADEDTATAYEAADTYTDDLVGTSCADCECATDETDREPIRLIEPNRATTGQAGYARDTTRLDAGVGHIIIDDPNADPIHRHDWSYLYATRTEVNDWIRWLLARKGRAESFRHPTWSMDLSVAAAIQPGAQWIDIEPIDWSRWYANRANRDMLAIETTDGTWYIAGVQSAAISGATERLTLDRELIEASSSPIPAASVRRACWLERLRLESDQIAISWLTNTVARSAVSFVGV